jgi:hypothetical protein
MFKNFFVAHQYKLILGAPIIFLVIINSTGALGLGNVFLFSTEAKNFSVVGDGISVNLAVFTKTPVNAIGGTIVFPPDTLRVESISRVSSAIDLWAEEPFYSNEDGIIIFAGGIVGTKTETPIRGDVLTVNFRVLKEGKLTLAIRDGQLLANDGDGTNVISGSNTLSLYAHDAGKASPDTNGDGVLSIADVNTLYLKTFREYDEQFDLNSDMKVNWLDVKLLIGLF